MTIHRHHRHRVPAGVVFAFAGLFIAGCGIFDTEAPRTEGPVVIFGGQQAAAPTTVGVNEDIWRASLDTLSFMPIRSTDPFGGTILTDWYTLPENPDERVRLNVRIRDRELSAASLSVTAFRQTRNAAGEWLDAETRPGAAAEIEDAILSRVRERRSRGR